MNWSSLIQDVLYLFITVLSPVIVKYLIDYIKSFKCKTENEKITSYLYKVRNIVADIVICVNQTYVNALKESGKFTKTEQEKAFQMAKDSAINLISTEIKDVVSTIYNDFDEYLIVLIESTVAQQKVEEKYEF